MRRFVMGSIFGLMLVVGVAVAHDPKGPIDGHIQTLEHLTAPDGGMVRAAASASGALKVVTESTNQPVTISSPISDAGAVWTQSWGYGSATVGCAEAICSTAGDGGTVAATIGARYISTVTGSAVRVANTTACNAYSAGVGRILPEDSVLELTARKNAVDGGAPYYTCCANVAGAVWQLCPQD